MSSPTRNDLASAAWALGITIMFCATLYACVLNDQTQRNERVECIKAGGSISEWTGACAKE